MMDPARGSVLKVFEVAEVRLGLPAAGDVRKVLVA
jgi:hypothetical protein